MSKVRAEVKTIGDCRNAFQQINNQIVPTPWTAYTPVLSGASSNPDIQLTKNGTLTGRYTHTSDWCLYTINLLTGTTSTYGSGLWTFSLPLTADVRINQIGTGWGFVNSVFYTFTPVIRSTELGTELVVVVSGIGHMTEAIPAWQAATASQQLELTIWYPIDQS